VCIMHVCACVHTGRVSSVGDRAYIEIDGRRVEGSLDAPHMHAVHVARCEHTVVLCVCCRAVFIAYVCLPCMLSCKDACSHTTCALPRILNPMLPLSPMDSMVCTLSRAHVRSAAFAASISLWPWHSLYNNNIGDEGARMLGAGLAQCPQFTTLQYAHWGMRMHVCDRVR
jgi:hypothetical protein